MAEEFESDGFTTLHCYSMSQRKVLDVLQLIDRINNFQHHQMRSKEKLKTFGTDLPAKSISENLP